MKTSIRDIPQTRVETTQQATQTARANDSAAVPKGVDRAPAVAYEPVSTLQARPERVENRNSGANATGRGNQQPIVIHMTVNTPDADSFKRSQSQIQSDLFRNIQRQAQRNN